MHLPLTSIRWAACFLVSLLVSVEALPSVALACEGPEANISIKPIESSLGGGKCHQNLLKTEVIFENKGEWCEYEVKNENTKEKLLLAQQQGFVNKGECEFAGVKLCLELVAVAAGHTRCGTGTILPVGVGKECYNRLQYENKTSKGGKEKMTLVVKAESLNEKGEPTGAKKTLTETQEAK